MTLRERSRGLLELTRPGNAVAAGVLTAIGAYVAGGAADHPGAVVAAVLATALATGGGNAINDYFDREIDRVNRPDRPIPRGAVSPRGALAFGGFQLLGAVAFVLVLPPAAIAIAVVNLLALVSYTELLKGLPGVGNLVVAYLTGSTLLFGGAAVGRPFGAAVLFVLAAAATLTREIVKDVEDVAGDREQGLRTLPIVVGERPALWVGTVVMALASLASLLPYAWDAFGLAYVALVLPADLLMLQATLQSFEDPSAGQRRLKRGTFLAAAAFVVGRLAATSGVTGLG